MRGQRRTARILTVVLAACLVGSLISQGSHLLTAGIAFALAIAITQLFRIRKLGDTSGEPAPYSRWKPGINITPAFGRKMWHEIRGPMASAHNYATNAKLVDQIKGATNEDVNNTLTQISEALETISIFSNVSRLYFGEDASTHNFSLEDSVRNVAQKLNQSRLRKTNIFMPRFDESFQIIGVRQSFEHVLTAILISATKRAAGERITLSLEKCASGVAINVHDFGQPLMDYEVEQLNNPTEFVSTLNDATKINALHVSAKLIAESLKIAITCKSSQTAGNEIRIEVTDNIILSSSAKQESDQEISAIKNKHDVSVLLVGHDETQREPLVRLLLNRFQIVTTTSSSKAAIEKWHEFGPEIIITDLHMKDMSAEDTIKLIREKEKEHNEVSTFIAVLTSDGDLNVVDVLLSAGADCVLTKPLNFNELESQYLEKLKKTA